MTAGKHVRALLAGFVGSPYLADTLAALAAQSRRPEEIVLAGLDTPTAESEQRWQELIDASGVDPATVRIVPVPRAATFGGAIRRALRAIDGGTDPDAAAGGASAAGGMNPKAAAGGTNAPGGTTEDSGQDPQQRWLWLLHDDSAPDERALEHLLGAVDVSNAIAVAGAKQVEWDDPDELISVGVRATRWGRRFTGIEDAEIDQGQHDGTDDVLAVGTAGMLIASGLWQELGGPDPALGPFEDGRDLSQRARLAGHRVVVVPRARVRHARARYHGLRPGQAAAGDRTDTDSRASFRRRREAILRLRLTSAGALAVPFLALAAVLVSLGRALWRVSAKELGLALDELLAPWSVLARPRSLVRGRRRARRTRVMPARRLRPLQATAGQVARVRRDRRLQAAAARRAARTPSELEMRERAALARKRRFTLAAVLVLTAALSAIAIVPTAFSGPLIGGALLPADASFWDLWHAANSTWITSGDGFAGPADPFLFVLVLLSGLTGGPLGVPVQVTIALLLSAAMPLAALTGWLAAGAATRSIMLRAWAGLAWALGPALLLGLGAGRLGLVVAHILLPLVFLGIVRSLGLDRRDVVVSGMVGARRVARRTSRRAGRSPGAVKRARLAALAGSRTATTEQTDAAAPVSEEGTAQENTATSESEASPAEAPATDEQSRAAAGGADSPQERRDRSQGEGRDQDAADHEEAGSAASPVSQPGPEQSGPERVSGPDWRGLRPIHSNTAEPVELEPETDAAVVSRVSHAPSLGAAAAAGLALAGAVAGAPVLLPAAIVALALVTVGVARRKALPAGRARLALVVIPALVLLVPLMLFAAGHDDGWRVFFAGPGAPQASDPGPAWLQLLAWPQQPAPGGLLPDPVGTWAPLAATGVIVLAALVALLRGGSRMRPVRLGWLVAIVGLATALISTHIAVAVAADGAGAPHVVHGYAGMGTSLVLAGLLTAVLTGADGLRGSLSRANFGWRQVTAVGATVLVVLTIAVAGTGYARAVIQDRSGAEPAQVMLLEPRTVGPVPALGLQQQQSEQQARVLMLTATAGGGVEAQLWRGNGPQLTETAATAQVRHWKARMQHQQDPARAALRGLVADLVSGSADEAAAALADHAISVIVVPPADSVITGVDQVDRSARSAMVATLDAVAGLDRVTENSAGVIWRVSTEQISAQEQIARITVRNGSGEVLTTVPARAGDLGGTISAEGTDRRLVLADRADSAWRAWLGGRQLRAVDNQWRQTFAIPDGAQGELVIRHHPLWLSPWRVVAVVVGGLALLLALPTRRRREERTR